MKVLTNSTLLPLNEYTLDQLHDSTDSAFPTTTGRHNAVGSVRVGSLSYKKLDNDKLMVTAKVHGSSGDIYSCQVLLDSVQFVDQPDVGTVTAGKLHFTPVESTQASVKCTCKDFYWTFAWYNGSEGSLIGKPPKPYRRKTDRGPRNPSKSVGLCKHLDKVREHLRQLKIIK